MQIKIPARDNAPTTELYVKILAEDETRLGCRPIIFALPGGPGGDHSTLGSYSCLQDVADIVFHDPRGTGQSEKSNPETYTMDNYIDDVEVIRQQLNLSKIIILGKSYGSMCAGAYAIRYPKAVAKLILAAGAPSYHFLETAKKNVLRRGTSEQIKACEKLWSGNFKNNNELLEFFKMTAPLYSNRAKNEPGSFNLAKNCDNFSCEALNLGFADFLRSFDYEAALTKIKCPTLILGGADDWINDIKYAKLMAEKIPHNQLKIFTNSSHAMETDIGESYFDEIRYFIKRPMYKHRTFF